MSNSGRALYIRISKISGTIKKNPDNLFYPTTIIFSEQKNELCIDRISHNSDKTS